MGIEPGLSALCVALGLPLLPQTCLPAVVPPLTLCLLRKRVPLGAVLAAENRRGQPQPPLGGSWHLPEKGGFPEIRALTRVVLGVEGPTLRIPWEGLSPGAQEPSPDAFQNPQEQRNVTQSQSLPSLMFPF